MLSLPVCPILAHVSCFGACRSLTATRIVFSAESGSAPASCPSNKKPDSKTCCRGQSQKLCGATPLDAASLPHPLIDCQHSPASYASITSSATRHLSPRPSGAHIIGFGLCRHHTIADSLSVRLPFSSRQRFVKLFLCYHRIFPLSTDFDTLSQIFRPIKPRRAPSAHTHTHHACETISHSPTRTCVLETPRARHTRRTHIITPTDGLAMSRAPTYTTDSHVIDFLPRLPHYNRAA